MMRKIKLTKKRGFSLVETMISLVVVVLVFTGISAFVLSNFQLEHRLELSNMALNLAREIIEPLTDPNQRLGSIQVGNVPTLNGQALPLGFTATLSKENILENVSNNVVMGKVTVIVTAPVQNSNIREKLSINVPE